MVFCCPVCDNETYNEDDGAFFCTECGTQSQEYHVVEASAPDFLHPGATRHEVAQAKCVEGRKKPRPSLGRPWTLYEAYQIIILAQADSLIAQGASKDLKDVVYTVWANYLSSIGVAFCKKELVVPEIVEKYKIGRPREIYRGTFEHPKNVKKQPVKTQQKKRGRKRKMSESGNEEEHIDDREEMGTKPQNPAHTIFMNESRLVDSADHQARLRCTANVSPQWMNIKKTIAINYIGLLFTNPNILPCDVVRWIYEGKVPYLSTSHLLPDDMVLSNFDSFLFFVERFDSAMLIQEVNKLTSFLGITNLPHPDLGVLVDRFIKELFLPKEFNLFAQRLVRKIPFLWNSTKTAYKRIEELALAYIVLSLKIVFGLDDISEKILSKHSEDLQKFIETAPKVFVWCDWKECFIQKQNGQFDAYREFTSDLSSNKLEHLDHLLHCKANLNQEKKRLTVRYLLADNGRKVRHYDPEYRDTLSKPLSAALSSLNDMSKSEAQIKGQSKCTGDFKESTVSHLVDKASFERKFQSIQGRNMTMCQNLLEKISSFKPKFVLYSFPVSESELASQRHKSYLWLLSVASNLVHCSMFSLDKTVVRLAEYFVQLSEGNSMEGVKCSKMGFISESKRKKRRIS